MPIEKIVTGGQTGVDRAALDAAMRLGIPVGGWCPKGRKAEDGAIPSRYPLRETPRDAYEQRTSWNVRDSDATLVIVVQEATGGTAYTIEEAHRLGKPLLQVKIGDPVPIPMIQAWREEHDLRVLNVAGPRASESDGIYSRARAIVDRFLRAERREDRASSPRRT